VHQQHGLTSYIMLMLATQGFDLVHLLLSQPVKRASYEFWIRPQSQKGADPFLETTNTPRCVILLCGLMWMMIMIPVFHSFPSFPVQCFTQFDPDVSLQQFNPFCFRW
jgi:hypothetical protein